MNKLKQSLMACAIVLPLVAIYLALFFLHKTLFNKENRYVCIENYMYMRVENSLLIYPNSIEPMRCEVFEYIEVNRGKHER